MVLCCIAGPTGDQRGAASALAAARAVATARDRTMAAGEKCEPEASEAQRVATSAARIFALRQPKTARQVRGLGCRSCPPKMAVRASRSRPFTIHASHCSSSPGPSPSGLATATGRAGCSRARTGRRGRDAVVAASVAFREANRRSCRRCKSCTRMCAGRVARQRSAEMAAPASHWPSSASASPAADCTARSSSGVLRRSWVPAIPTTLRTRPGLLANMNAPAPGREPR
mmetsp:Transcript_15508/g.58813  ORF Transcript_15508/g.58813 Transcript_15508/m.58813 type:complete len:229 (+) Transcript_15508:238-924(+)